MNIFVGNLSPQITADDLRLTFAAFGHVDSVNMMDDRYIGSGQPATYGFVTMASKAEAEAAVTGLTGKSLQGRDMIVIASLPLSPRSRSSSVPKSLGRPQRPRRR